MNGDNLIGPVEYKRRFGFITHSGEFVIAPLFEALGRFKEGLACFRKEGRYGFIDSKGEVAIAPVFESTRVEGPSFGSGYAAVGQNGKIGYIDHRAGWVIPAKFVLGRDFLDKFAVVDVAGAEAESFVIDKEGQMLTRLEVYEVPDVPGWPPNWDLFGCFFMVNGELLTGFLNWKGEILFPPRYPYMTDFFEGLAGFCENAEEPRSIYGLVALSGEVLRKPCFYEMGNFQEGLARAGRSPKEFGFINSRGEWVIEPKFRQAQPFSDGLACVTLDDNTRRGKKGFINLKGEMVIEPRFDRESSFHRGFAQVEYDGKRAVIDKSARVIWETEIE